MEIFSPLPFIAFLFPLNKENESIASRAIIHEQKVHPRSLRLEVRNGLEMLKKRHWLEMNASWQHAIAVSKAERSQSSCSNPLWKINRGNPTSSKHSMIVFHSTLLFYWKVTSKMKFVSQYQETSFCSLHSARFLHGKTFIQSSSWQVSRSLNTRWRCWWTSMIDDEY